MGGHGFMQNHLNAVSFSYFSAQCLYLRVCDVSTAFISLLSKLLWHYAAKCFLCRFGSGLQFSYASTNSILF